VNQDREPLIECGDPATLAVTFALAALAALSVLALCSCQTAQVLLQAPECFWLTCENLISALWADVLSVFGL
jgi:hypothetical protein